MSRSNGRTSSGGLSYEEVVQGGQTGNSLMPEGQRGGLSRANSRASVRSNRSSRFKRDLESYKAIRITFFKNGDQWFKGFDFRFRQAKDYEDIDSLLERISPRMDFNSSVTHLFDTDGNRIELINDLEDRKCYVASNSRRFKAGNYGKTGEKFLIKSGKTKLGKIGGNRARSGSSKNSGDSKPGSANSKVIKIVNNDEPTIFEKVLLNLKTTQSFEEVLDDLGQVLQIRRANKMYTAFGDEVKSFSSFRNEFSDQEIFVISSGPTEINRAVVELARSGSDSSSPTRRARTRNKSRSRNGNEEGAIEAMVDGTWRTYLPPEGFRSNNDEAPDGGLVLEWVNGYSGSARRGNLVVVERGEVVYSVGAVVVVWARGEERQRHYRGHTQEVTCLALHPGGEVVASGQEGEEGAHCRVWNVFTMDTVAVLGLEAEKGGIAGLSFSLLNRGQYLAFVQAQTLSVWDWSSENTLAVVSVDTSKVSGLAFHPFDNNLLITYGGKGHLAFWNRKKDGTFTRSDVGDKSLSYTCITFLDSGDLVAGDTSGGISTFTVSNEGEYFRSLVVSAHHREVSALLVLGSGVLLSAGGHDRRLVAWDSVKDFALVQEVELPAKAGGAVALQPGRSQGQLYVGTNRSLVLEGSMQSKFEVLVWSHSQGVTSLAPHPSSLAYVTAGQDRVVAVWREVGLAWRVELETEPTSTTYQPGGGVVVVGTTDGYMVVLRAESGAHVTTVKVCDDAISAITFSRSGDRVALASSSGTIYLYRVARDQTFLREGKMSGGLELTQLDWDQEGGYIQTSSKDFSLQFWNTSSMTIEKSSAAVREVEWLAPTSLVGWAVAGVWANAHYSTPADTVITSVHTAAEARLVVTGDTEGRLRLFLHPCTSTKAQFREQRPVTGPLQVVRFLAEGSQVVALAGREGATFRYTVR